MLDQAQQEIKEKDTIVQTMVEVIHELKKNTWLINHWWVLRLSFLCALMFKTMVEFEKYFLLEDMFLRLFFNLCCIIV